MVVASRAGFEPAFPERKPGVLGRLDEHDETESPLRLCPNASIPSDVVSRCTGSGQGPRTSRITNTMPRDPECMDTPEVVRTTSLELVAPTP